MWRERLRVDGPEERHAPEATTNTSHDGPTREVTDGQEQEGDSEEDCAKGGSAPERGADEEKALQKTEKRPMEALSVAGVMSNVKIIHLEPESVQICIEQVIRDSRNEVQSQDAVELSGSIFRGENAGRWPVDEAE